MDPAIERSQRERTHAWRAGRDTAAADAALDDVRRVASTEENLLPALREALRRGCTIGEICGVLRDLWGTYDGQHA